MRRKLELAKINAEIEEFKNQLVKKNAEIEEFKNQLVKSDRKLANTECAMHCLEKENQELRDIISRIRSGELEFADTYREHKRIDDCLKVYNEIQDAIREYEDDSGQCYDAISDHYFELFYEPLEQEQKALSMGFIPKNKIDVSTLINRKEKLIKELDELLLSMYERNR